jgi:outer membrane lipoprotein SlyB
MGGPWDKYQSSDSAAQKPWEKYGAAPAPQEPDSELKAQGKRIMSAIDQTNHEQGTAITGTGEAALNMATGIGSSVVGGWRGLMTLATGGSLEDATKAIRDTQSDYTYQPRTGVGKLESELVAAPVTAAKAATSAVGGYAGEKLAGEKGRLAGEAIGDVLPDVAMTLAGGRAAMRGAGRAVDAKPAPAPAAAPATPAINYDVPAYVRKGLPAPETTPAPAVPAPVAASPEAAPIKAPIASSAEAALREVEAQPAADSAPVPAMATEVAPQAAASIEAPVKFAEPAAKLTESLRDTSDIDSMLKQFGVETPEPAPLPVDPVERAAGAIAPIDDSVRVPADAPPPAAPPAAPPSPVERANGPAAPLDDTLRAPTSFGQKEAEQPFVATPERHVDPALRDQHLQVLRDIGLENIRESAVNGDSAAAAREFQHGKFTSEPAGQFWFDQFQRETDAMKGYAQRLVDDTKGRTGLDSDSLEQKGRDIAAPYDAARSYFEKAKQNLYDIANKRAEEIGAPVKTEKLDALLSDPDFKATLMAKDQQGLLNTIISQYERFKDLDPNKQMTVLNAERYRKWLNAVWSPENSGTLGKVKAALDDDVFKTAGTDVYAAAREMHKLEKATLDDPNGISKLMDSDPNTPINRATPYEAIPNALVKLSNEQFKHIIDTYKSLPPELQPIAQQAIATLKAHYAERLLSAGSETAYGNGRQLWNAGGVKKFASDNSAKLPMIFDASELARIQNLLKAGEILRVNPAYPGAAAQAANASKAGLMSAVAGKVGAGVGGAVGALVAGPFGAGAGGLAGDAIAGRMSKMAGEREALKRAKSAVISEFRTERQPRDPIEEWEQGLR